MVFDEIRAATAAVASRARFVAIDDARLAELALELACAGTEPPTLDPAHHYRGSESTTLAFVFSFRIKRGWIWILGICLLRIPFFFLTSNTHLWQNPEALSGMREMMTGAACISGLLLGLVVVAGRCGTRE